MNINVSVAECLAFDKPEVVSGALFPATTLRFSGLVHIVLNQFLILC